VVKNLREPDEGLGGKSLDGGNGLDELLSLGLGRKTLDLDPLGSLLGLGGVAVLSLDTLVLLDAGNEVSMGLGRLDVLNAEVDTLGNDTATNALVDDNANSTAGHVPNDTGLTVVELVGHTLVESTITLDIDDITDLVDGLEASEGDLAGFAEILSEKVAGTSAITEGVRHLLTLLQIGEEGRIRYAYGPVVA
jgi:hypothetical protein